MAIFQDARADDAPARPPTVSTAATAVPAAHPAPASSPLVTVTPSPVPRTVEKGGGVGRFFAWTTLVTGIGAGIGAGALYYQATRETESCREQAGAFGGGCGSSRQADEMGKVAVFVGVGGGALLATSLLLFLVTDAARTEIVYDAPLTGAMARSSTPSAPTKAPPLIDELPLVAYGATAAAAGAGVFFTLWADAAERDLLVPERHPTRDDTSALVLRVRGGRAAAGGLYALSAGLATWATIDTVRAVLRRRSESERSGDAPPGGSLGSPVISERPPASIGRSRPAQVGIAPAPDGLLLSMSGSF